MRKAMLVKLSSLGDVIFNIPLANVLKKNGYEVTWLVSEKGIDVVDGNPAVKNAILVPFQRWKKNGFSIKNILEFIDIIKRIRKENLLTKHISLHINYSKNTGGYFSISKKLDQETNDEALLYKTLLNMFNSYYEENMPVRKVGISLSKLEKNNHIQLNLFENIKEVNDKNNLNNTIDKINDKYGNNSILKATSLLSNSTIKSRNEKIGGHNAR